jgi:hypothetical protein
MTQLNENKLNALIGKMLGDLSGAFGVPTRLNMVLEARI